MVVDKIAQEKQLRIIAEKEKEVMEKQLYQLQEKAYLVNKALVSINIIANKFLYLRCNLYSLI